MPRGGRGPLADRRGRLGVRRRSGQAGARGATGSPRPGLLEKIRLVPDVAGGSWCSTASSTPPSQRIRRRLGFLFGRVAVHGALAVRRDQPGQHQRAVDRGAHVRRLRRRPARRGGPRDAALRHPRGLQRRVAPGGARPVGAAVRGGRPPGVRLRRAGASTSSTTPRSAPPGAAQGDLARPLGARRAGAALAGRGHVAVRLHPRHQGHPGTTSCSADLPFVVEPGDVHRRAPRRAQPGAHQALDRGEGRPAPPPPRADGDRHRGPHPDADRATSSWTTTRSTGACGWRCSTCRSATC